MRFNSPASPQTPLAEQNGTPALFWRNWLNAVASWLMEASRVNVTDSVAWSQQGQIVFLTWSGAAGTIQFGAVSGKLPKPSRNALLLQADGTALALASGASELSLTQPAQGWYFSEGA